MMGKIKKIGTVKRGGFTLVELLVTASIAGSVAVMGISYGNSFKNAQNNTQRLSDVETLGRAAEAHFQAKGDYPEPTGNRIYFDSRGAYAHSEKGAYGVSSSATSDLFGAEFLADVPTDPETGNAYGYGKRKDGVAAYDFASVDRRGGIFYAHVRGKSDGSSLSSLIREYAGPGFVENGNSERLPYNPYEKKITARIGAHQGSVRIEPSKSLTGELSENDVIRVPAGGYVILHVSDGSEVRIGSNAVESEAKLQELANKDGKKFLTKVRLALNSGEMWAKAPKLRTDRGESSEMEIVADGVVASVRGTVFGVSRIGGRTDVVLVVGKLAVSKNGTPANAPGLTDGVMTVPDGGVPKKVSFETPTATVPAVAPAPEAAPQLAPWKNGSAGVRARIRSVIRNGSAFKVAFDNSQRFSKVVLDVAKYLPGAANTTRTVSGTGTVEVTFPVAGLPGYPKAEDASKMVRLPLSFETDEGGVSEVELALQVDGNVEASLESLPQGGGTECEANSTWFPKLGCQSKSLRLYAPFDEFSTDGKSGNLGAYDRNGRVLEVFTEGIVRTDANGKQFIAIDGSAANAPASHVAFGEFPTGMKGVTVSKWAHKPYVAYNLALAGIGSNFSIDVGVQLSSLRRGFADIEKISEEPGVEGAKFAYLWSLGDGTSAYLRPGDDGSRFLIIKSSSGSVVSSIQIPNSIDTYRDQKAHVQAIFLQESGKTYARLAVFIEDVSGALYASEPKETELPKLDRLYLGSSFPYANGANFKFESQWGWVSGATGGQPIDYLKVFSYDDVGTKANSEPLPVGSRGELKGIAKKDKEPKEEPEPLEPMPAPAPTPTGPTPTGPMPTGPMPSPYYDDDGYDYDDD